MSYIRKLGHMEARMHYMQASLEGTTQGCLALRLTGKIDSSKLMGAIKKVVTNIPLLQSVIIEDDDTLAFMQPDNFLHPIQSSTLAVESQWLDVFNRENNMPLDHRTALWRIMFCQVESDPNTGFLFVTLHHSIADGSSADIFIDQIFQACQAQSSLGQYPVLPAAEQKLPSAFVQSWDDFLSSFSKMASSADVHPQAFDQSVPLIDRKTKTRCITLSEEHLKEVENFCDNINLPLNSFLSAALLKAYAAVKYENNIEGSVSFHTTFSLRRLCALDQTSFGCYMTVVPMVFGLGELSHSLKDVMRFHHKKISKAILKTSKQPSEYNLQELKEQTLAIEKLQSFSCDMGFTYGESIIKDRYGDIAIDFICPTVNRSAGNIGIVLHCLKHAGRLHISVNCTLPNQNGEFIEQVSQAFHKNLLVDVSVDYLIN